MNPQLAGVYAAALTPIKPDSSLSLDDIPMLLNFLARRGCHGALLLGTTGEGPSFSFEERLAVLRTAVLVREAHPDFRLLAGTGTPSLDETIKLTSAAFDLGFNGVVVLPPYFYRKASEDGLYAWFEQVLQRSVPTGGALFGYHIPQVSGVSLSFDLIARLKDRFPDRFYGIKDSAGDADHARRLGELFGYEIVVLNGNDSLFSLALENFASGCITALGNLCSPYLRKVWDAYSQGDPIQEIQLNLTLARQVLDRYQPAPPTLKVVIARLHQFPRWNVRLPLLPLPLEQEEQLMQEIDGKLAFSE